MATYIKTLKEDNDDIIYPQTKGSAVLLDGGSDLETVLAAKADASTVNQKITVGDVQSTDIVANAVTTAKIADSNVTTAKLASNSVTTDKIADGAVTSDKIDWTSLASMFCNWIHGGGTITTSTLTNKLQIALPEAGKYAIFYNMNTYNQAGGFNGEVNTRLLCGSNTSGTLTTYIPPTNWASTANADVATFTTTADNEIVYLQASVNWPSRGTCYISAQSYLAYLRIG